MTFEREPRRTARLLDGDLEYAGQMVSQVAALIAPPNLLKVILESGELGDADADVVAAAATLAIENGADFVKTSTGKVPAGASISAATAMIGAIAEARDQGRSIGLKPSGVRSYADAVSYIDVAESVMGSGWATPATLRFGASGLLDAPLEVLDGSDLSSNTDPNGY